MGWKFFNDLYGAKTPNTVPSTVSIYLKSIVWNRVAPYRVCALCKYKNVCYSLVENFGSILTANLLWESLIGFFVFWNSLATSSLSSYLSLSLRCAHAYSFFSFVRVCTACMDKSHVVVVIIWFYRRLRGAAVAGTRSHETVVALDVYIFALFRFTRLI